MPARGRLARHISGSSRRFRPGLRGWPYDNRCFRCSPVAAFTLCVRDGDGGLDGRSESILEGGVLCLRVTEATLGICGPCRRNHGCLQPGWSALRAQVPVSKPYGTERNQLRWHQHSGSLFRRRWRSRWELSLSGLRTERVCGLAPSPSSYPSGRARRTAIFLYPSPVSPPTSRGSRGERALGKGRRPVPGRSAVRVFRTLWPLTPLRWSTALGRVD